MTATVSETVARHFIVTVTQMWVRYIRVFAIA